MNPPDPADDSTGAAIAPMPKTTMPAAKIREAITLLHAYAIGPHRNKVSAFFMTRANRQ
jgi:hypothetical protein